ncbi:unnamed protein product [Periconia digitata]|uniref:Uncharacterized protein n=1 Tax=Periconia digitata TaxID=1303443 RepID=A0A9W4XZG4_9PLEO|nr:unnamed protein product [Periconia digitata]
MTMPLLCLANELLISISENFESEKDINAFARTCRRLYLLTNDYLYRYHYLKPREEYDFHQWAMEWAVQNGRETTIQKLLDGANLGNEYIRSRNDLMRLAVDTNQHGVVQLLLHYGIDIQAKVRSQHTALHVAVDRPDYSEKMIKLLLDNGADFNSPGYGRDDTPLEKAYYLGQAPVMKMFFEYGLDIDSLSGYLASAAWNDRLEIVKLLIENGADVNENDGSALDYAVGVGNEEMVKMLLRNGAKANLNHSKALLQAAWRGYYNLLKIIWESGATIDNHNGDVLLFALEGQHIEVADLLMEYGAVLRKEDPATKDALCDAAASNQKITLRFLLEHGMNPNESQGLPLANAACKGNLDIMGLLLDFGADIDTRCEDGHTAIYKASKDGRFESVRLLLDRGAKINVEDEDWDHPIQQACGKNQKDLVRLLLENGVDVNHEGGEYGSLLAAAMIPGGKPFVLELLQRGANVNVKGGKHGTPLGLAAAGRKRTDVALVRLLIDEYDADVNACYEGQFTAFQQALIGSSDGSAQLLLQRGADVNLNHSLYNEVFHRARKFYRSRIRKLLMENGLRDEIRFNCKSEQEEAWWECHGQECKYQDFRMKSA